ncbi:MAG: hypothetical protein LBV23_05720, partial [Deltaproteobacteria bacterium]|nr:hypothetical protein [Deltaproteobacteria bacterium]
DPFLDKFKALSLRLERPASPIGEVVSQALKLLAPENLSSCTRPIIFVAGNFYFAPKSALNSDFSSFSVESWLSSLKDLNLVLGPQALSRSEEIYGLELGPSADYPPIFILRGRDGQIVHRLALWPKAIFNDSSESLGPIEWQIIDWEADKEGHPFKLEIEAIFALESGEALRVRYKIELLFSSAQDNVSSKRAKIDSGELKGARLYLFENERGANNLSYLRAIDLALVEGFLVTTSLLESNSNQLAAIGYEISGSNRDGPYFDLTLGAFSKQEFLTPEGRVLVGSDLSAHSRAHSLGPSSFLNTGQGLLALVAQSNLGRRLGQLPLGRKREYFSLLHLNDLYQRLSPLTRFSGGEAFFSSIPAPNFSYAGGALAIGSVWWPALGKSADGFWLDGESQASLGVGWAGTVYALWLDNSAKLIGLEGPKGLFSRFLTFLTPRPSYPAQGAFWDAGRWLAELDPQGDRLLSGSRKWEVAATRNQGQRLIWSTEPNSDSLLLFNGSEESIKSFEPHLLNIKSWESFSDIWQNNSERLAMTLRLVDWIVGAQRPNLRNRMFKSPWESNRNLIWRLGDTINSKPVLVGAPSCGYEAIYSSSSYADFKVQYSKRRRMVYFGANDGMLHAVNAGFLKDPSLGPLGFDKEGPNNETPHELGAEMWAYIPASVLPKLQWLAEPGYQHSFYIDLKPLITDVKINGQWRTVLIGGLGLGGRLIESPSGGEPVFSEIFCLDITDPEKPPKFMWRYQSFALGLTVGLPAAVVSGGRWRIIVPSGPITDRVDKDGQLIYGLNSPYEGLSERPARVIVLDAETGKRVDKEGQLTVPATEGHSFFGSAVVPMAHGVVGGAEEWNNHVVYFGLSQSFDPVTGLEGGGVYRLRMVDPTTFEPLSPDKWALERFVSLKRPISGAVNLTRDGLGNIWVLFGAGRLFSQRDLNPCLNSESVQCQENHENYFYGLKEPRDPQSGLITFEDLSEKLEEVIDVSDITVLSDGSLKNAERSSYGELSRELLEKNSLGWRRKLNLARFIDSKGAGREIFYGQPRLTAFGRGGSLLIFSSFEPRVNPQSCTSLGLSYLYVLDAFTGLPNPDLNLNALNFAPLSLEGSYKELSGEVAYELLAGLAKPISYDLAPSPSLVKSASGLVILYLSAAGLTALNVTSEFIPVNSIISWREVVDMGFKISDNVMSLGVDTAND